MWLLYFLINGKIKQNIWIDHNFLWAILETISFPRIITPFWCRKKINYHPWPLFEKIRWVCCHPRRPETGGGGGGGKRRAEIFKAQAGKPPGYRLSPDHFQTVKQMLAPDWAEKMLCIIVPSWQTASPKFFSLVRTWLLLTRSQLVWLMHQRNARSQEIFS